MSNIQNKRQAVKHPPGCRQQIQVKHDRSTGDKGTKQTNQQRLDYRLVLNTNQTKQGDEVQVERNTVEGDESKKADWQAGKNTGNRSGLMRLTGDRWAQEDKNTGEQEKGCESIERQEWKVTTGWKGMLPQNKPEITKPKPWQPQKSKHQFHIKLNLETFSHHMYAISFVTTKNTIVLWCCPSTRGRPQISGLVHISCSNLQ